MAGQTIFPEGEEDNKRIRTTLFISGLLDQPESVFGTLPRELRRQFRPENEAAYRETVDFLEEAIVDVHTSYERRQLVRALLKVVARWYEHERR